MSVNTHNAAQISILAAIAADPNVSPAFGQAIRPHGLGIQAYERALAEHDWAHEFSDDGAVYQRGRVQLLALREQQRRIDPNFEIWNRFCAPQCKDGRSYA